jgi:hypothetical protein
MKNKKIHKSNKKLLWLGITGVVITFLVYSLVTLYSWGTGPLSSFITSIPGINYEMLEDPNDYSTAAQKKAAMQLNLAATAEDRAKTDAAKKKAADKVDAAEVALKTATNTAKADCDKKKSQGYTWDGTRCNAPKTPINNGNVAPGAPAGNNIPQGNVPAGAADNSNGGQSTEKCTIGTSQIRVGDWVPTGEDMTKYGGTKDQRACVQITKDKNGCSHSSRVACDVKVKEDPIHTVLPIDAGFQYTGGTADAPKKIPNRCVSTNGPISSGNKNEKGETCFNGQWVDTSKTENKDVIKNLGNDYCKQNDPSNPEWNADLGKCDTHVQTQAEVDEANKKAAQAKNEANAKLMDECNEKGLHTDLKSMKCGDAYTEAECHTQHRGYVFASGKCLPDTASNVASVVQDCHAGLQNASSTIYVTCNPNATTARGVVFSHYCQEDLEYVDGVGCSAKGKAVNASGTKTGGESVAKESDCRYGGISQGRDGGFTCKYSTGSLVKPSKYELPGTAQNGVNPQTGAPVTTDTKNYKNVGKECPHDYLSCSGFCDKNERGQFSSKVVDGKIVCDTPPAVATANKQEMTVPEPDNTFKNVGKGCGKGYPCDKICDKNELGQYNSKLVDGKVICDYPPAVSEIQKVNASFVDNSHKLPPGQPCSDYWIVGNSCSSGKCVSSPDQKKRPGKFCADAAGIIPPLTTHQFSPKDTITKDKTNCKYAYPVSGGQYICLGEDEGTALLKDPANYKPTLPADVKPVENAAVTAPVANTPTKSNGTVPNGQKCHGLFGIGNGCESGKCTLTGYDNLKDDSAHWYCTDANGKLPILPNDPPANVQPQIMKTSGGTDEKVWKNKEGKNYNSSWCLYNTDCISGFCSPNLDQTKKRCKESILPAEPIVSQVSNSQPLTGFNTTKDPDSATTPRVSKVDLNADNKVKLFDTSKPWSDINPVRVNKGEKCPYGSRDPVVPKDKPDTLMCYPSENSLNGVGAPQPVEQNEVADTKTISKAECDPSKSSTFNAATETCTLNVGKNAYEKKTIPKKEPPANSYALNDGYSVFMQNGSYANVSIKNVGFSIPEGTTMNLAGCGPATMVNTLKILNLTQGRNDGEVLDDVLHNSNFYISCTVEKGCQSGAGSVLQVLQNKYHIPNAFTDMDKNKVVDASKLQNATGVFIYQGDVSDPTVHLSSGNTTFGHNATIVCKNGNCQALDSYTGNAKPQSCTIEGQNQLKCGTTTYNFSTSGYRPSAAYQVPGTENIGNPVL